MNKNLKKVSVNDLVVGKKYLVKCGIWQANVVYTHSELIKCRTFYNFTFGKLENYQSQFNIFSTKSNIKIYEEIY